MKAAILLGFLAAATPAARAADGPDASQMLSQCQWVKGAVLTDERVILPKNAGAYMCFGYFGAVQDLITAFPGICIPSEVRETQIIRVFVAYAEAHPETLHEQPQIIALTALAAAFPCTPHKPQK